MESKITNNVDFVAVYSIREMEISWASHLLSFFFMKRPKQVILYVCNVILYADSFVCMERMFLCSCVLFMGFFVVVRCDLTNNLSRISSQIIQDCNTEVGKMKQMEELIQINGMLEFDKLKVSYWLMLYINNDSYNGIKKLRPLAKMALFKIKKILSS